MSEKIAIMGAMEDAELNLLKEHMHINQEYHESKYTFYEGMIGEKEVVLVCTGVGTINASASTMLAILRYKPKIIISSRNCWRSWRTCPSKRFGNWRRSGQY